MFISDAPAAGAMAVEFDVSDTDVEDFEAAGLAGPAAPNHALASSPAPPWPLICKSLRRELLGGVSSKCLLQRVAAPRLNEGHRIHAPEDWRT